MLDRQRELHSGSAAHESGQSISLQPVAGDRPDDTVRPLGVGVPNTLTKQATNTRDLARRARRLASTLTAAEDVAARLLRYADELEVQATDLDRRAKEGA